MEASESGFESGADSPEDDPFAGSDFGEFGDDSPAAPPAAEIPVVNAEGEVIQPALTEAQQHQAAVEAGAVDPPSAPTAGAGTAQSATPGQTGPDGEALTAAAEPEFPGRTVGPPTASGAEPVPDPTPASPTATTAVAGAPAPSSPPAAPSEPAASTATPEQEAARAKAEEAQSLPVAEGKETVAEAQEKVTEAVDEVSVKPDAAAESDLQAAEVAEIQAEHDDMPESAIEDAPEPVELKDKKDRITHRKYVILRVTGSNKFEQIGWYEDKEGKTVARGATGAKRQKIALARDAEGALRMGYAILGAPPEGVPLVAVAASLFQVKTVAPAEPQPAQRRLKIS